MSQRTLKFVIHKGGWKRLSNGKPVGDNIYFWATIVASNGRILFTSEMYKTKRVAVNACKTVFNGVIRGNGKVKIIDTTIKNARAVKIKNK